MRSYVWAALKLGVKEFDGTPAKFASLIKEIVVFGAQQRGNRDAFVQEVAGAVGHPATSVERWTQGVSLPHLAFRRDYLQRAFDQILARRP